MKSKLKENAYIIKSNNVNIQSNKKTRTQSNNPGTQSTNPYVDDATIAIQQTHLTEDSHARNASSSTSRHHEHDTRMSD